MTEMMKLENAASISERIARNSDTVAQWAADCLTFDPNAVCGVADLYTAYVSHCHRENVAPFARKTWIATMKLAGFETESGAFAGLAPK